MKVTVVSVRVTPWEVEGRSGVSVQADALIEIQGVARVCRLKLAREQAGLQPGNYHVDVEPYVDGKGLLGFRIGALKPMTAKGQ